MAYADNQSANRTLGAGAAVLALEAGLAWAVIAGLAMTINRTDKPRIATFAIPDQPKIIPPPPQPQASAQPDQPAPRPRTDPIYDLGPVTLPTFAADNKLGSGDAGTVEFPRVQPTPSPVPSFAPTAARPKGKTAGWVTTNDYPTSDLRQEHEGSTRYRLTIDASGKVRDCAVVASSGFAGLDQATCAQLTRRGQFDPATDDSGGRVAGSYSGMVTWRLPPD